MFKLHNPISKALRKALAAYDDTTAELLARRTIHTSEDAQAFLAPSYDEHIGDPLTMLNMEKAAKRVAQAIDSGEKICVWSDYDCDGIPGGVILHDFFKKVNANFTNYIPHRHLEGFGLNTEGIDSLAKEEVKLIITVDCGITDVEAVAHANTLGIDVIITDHHLPAEVLPEAYAIVDPKQDGETYPFKDFCGGGLAWKLVCAVLAVGFVGHENIPEGWEKWLLDMAGLATIADMVPLLGENRVIAKYGLMVMRKSPRIGFQKLCSIARVNQRLITEEDIGFMIAPRVNATSRMGEARDAFELFTTNDEVRADTLAKEIEKINRARKALGGSVTRAAHLRLNERKKNGELGSVIVMGDPDWRPGLLGLVANSLAQEYERPVFLWGRDGGVSLKGSCRAGRKDVSVVAIMQKAREGTFVEFGGHAASGGFSVVDDAVFSLEERLCHAYEELSHSDFISEETFADIEVLPQDALSDHLKRTSAFAPFGMGNPKPTFLLRNMEIRKASLFGKGEEHLRLTLVRPQTSRESVEAICFFAKRELGTKTPLEGEVISLLANLEKDQFTRGQPVRLRIVALS
jgi:single-stranded-DNA-specific exonuclease